MLAFLDDYEPRNKIIGAMLLSDLLDRSDSSLLNRTGLGAVFQNVCPSLEFNRRQF